MQKSTRYFHYNFSFKKYYFHYDTQKRKLIDQIY
jgi:hypothetical protein